VSFDIQGQGPQTREAPDICPVCPMVIPALDKGHVTKMKLNWNFPNRLAFYNNGFKKDFNSRTAYARM